MATFESFRIERRALLLEDKTIAISSIASVTIGVLVPPNGQRERRLAAAYVGAALFALAQAAPTSGWFSGTIAQSTVFLAMAAYCFLAAIFLLVHSSGSAPQRLYLCVSCNDGSKAYFTGHDEFLQRARLLLTEKINAIEANTSYTVNFANGTIENLNLGTVESFKADTVVSGNNTHVAANSPGARVASPETPRNTHATTHTATHYTASNSPGAQVGRGNVVQGSTVTAAVTLTDYSAVLPEIERWRASAAGSPGWEHVAERLARLEALLNDGTPTAEQKQAARGLAIDLSQILQGYPAAVQLFQGVLRLIGG